MAGLLLAGWAMAGQNSATAQEDTSPLHPVFPLLDVNGENVLDSGLPVSTIHTCGTCHNTEFIATHSFHTDVGLASLSQGKTLENGHTWDLSNGMFGDWNAITYRYLSPVTDTILDLTTPEWVRIFGVRHVGGGPATLSRDGTPLIGLEAEADNPETTVWGVDEDLTVWEWTSSGTVEMNCFLCHTANPDNSARIEALQNGEFAWASTATLLKSGVVQKDETGWQWQAEAFDAEGNVQLDLLGLQDPTSQNCGQCHGAVHTDAQDPLILERVCDVENTTDWTTLTTGQIISPQRMSISGLNLADKTELTRSFDVHAERVLECVNCHYSLNNPIYYTEDADSQPDHLKFDPRRLDFGEYLQNPSHQFATGENVVNPTAAYSMRTCETCHTIDTHDWLPYQERHAQALACESCHIPTAYGPALQALDWTVLTPGDLPQTECRGLADNDGAGSNALLEGYNPVLLPREDADGDVKLAPHNLITSWYWVYGEGDATRPVPLRYLETVFFGSVDSEIYTPTVLGIFDADQDGTLTADELTIDTSEKENFIAAQLTESGLNNPRIVGEIVPYSLHHSVTHDQWATRDCQACHTGDSRVTEIFVLSENIPAEVMPTFLNTSRTRLSGDVEIQDGKLIYQPDTISDEVNVYILGHHSVPLVDWAGLVIVLGTMFGVVTHSTLRYLAARKRPANHQPLKRVYMYTFYERQWHWLQTGVILGLIFTGLIIHKPDIFGMFSFRYTVQVHNVLAAILIINAFLAAFYHFASGDIQQYLPQPRGLLYQPYRQAVYYLRGIFRGDPHPFNKSPNRKLNPLQQITYLVILNFLLPLQIITGALMWGAQHYPDIAEQAGGLPFLAPIHTLCSWLFVSFIVMHVYLTTTGHTPLAGIQAMIMGWDHITIPDGDTDTVTKTEAI
jgi:thiosulfate reductase cytochrome b subunit